MSPRDSQIRAIHLAAFGEVQPDDTRVGVPVRASETQEQALKAVEACWKS